MRKTETEVSENEEEENVEEYDVEEDMDMDMDMDLDVDLDLDEETSDDGTDWDDEKRVEITRGEGRPNRGGRATGSIGARGTRIPGPLSRRPRGMSDSHAGRPEQRLPVTVAIVDSGVHTPHPHLPEVAGGIALLPDGSASDDFVDRLGHGTATAAAIHEKAPDAELFAVKVFERELATTVSTLVRAISCSGFERGSNLLRTAMP